MKLITKEIERALLKAPLYSTEKQDTVPIIVKFFTPDSSWTWYVIEAGKTEEGDWEFFGLVDGLDKELGYFTLSELKTVRGQFNLPIERDMYFHGQLTKSTNTVTEGK